MDINATLRRLAEAITDGSHWDAVEAFNAVLDFANRSDLYLDTADDDTGRTDKAGRLVLRQVGVPRALGVEIGSARLLSDDGGDES